MSRFLIAGTTIVVLSQLVAAQSGPTEIHYDLNTFHTYLLSPSGVDWQAGQAYARSLGGHLASITDLGEQNFINARYANHPRFWIGLSDAQNEGTFVWDSGEPYVYANWCGGEPNNAGGVEDHVEAFHTPTGFCWKDISSPYSGTASAPNQALIELPFGDRVTFEVGLFGTCLPLPSPLGAPGDYDGASWNGAGATSMHNAVRAMLPTGVPNVTWPVEGNVYVLVASNGPVAVPVGGPFQRPAPAIANEVRIPIPPGAKGVSYAWEFLTAEDNSGIYNDGISIAVVGADGQLILDLTYADATSPKETNVPAAVYCSNPPTPVLPTGASGPQTACYAFPPLPFPAYLSVVSWNGGDNSISGAAAIDAIQFWGTGSFKLAISAPAGPGSISLFLTGGGPFNVYTTAVSLSQGAFPYGWLFGVDIGFDTLLGEMASGAPFHGTLSGGGIKLFNMASGVPSGLSLYAVSLQFTPPGPFGGSFAGATAPEFFLTP
jgi:Lectin C-type domain